MNPFLFISVQKIYLHTTVIRTRTFRTNIQKNRSSLQSFVWRLIVLIIFFNKLRHLAQMVSNTSKFDFYSVLPVLLYIKVPIECVEISKVSVCTLQAYSPETAIWVQMYASWYVFLKRILEIKFCILNIRTIFLFSSKMPIFVV